MTPRLLLLLLLCVGVKSLFSQNNIIKGRFIGLPGDKPKTFSMGIGYERFLNERISAQLLLNRYAFDQSSTDGSSMMAIRKKKQERTGRPGIRGGINVAYRF